MLRAGAKSNKMKNTEKIGVVIVAYNNIGETVSSIDSVLRSDYKNLQILVIDNGSSVFFKDKLSSAIKEKFQGVELKYLANAEGYGAACNLGARYFSDKGIAALLFLNNDVILDETCITRLMENLTGDTVMCGPKVYIGLTNIIQSTGGFFSKKLLIVKNRGNGEPDSGQYAKKEEVEFINGCAFLVSEKIFWDLKGFDEKFYYYSEEADLCYRIKEAGLKIVYEPLAVVHHMVSTTMGIESKKAMYYMPRGYLYFLDKHNPGNKIKIVLLGLAYVFYNYTFKFVYSRLGKILTRQRAVLRGVADFFRNKMGKGPYE